MHGSALAVAENHDEGQAQYSDGVFEAGDRMDVCEIARYAADKDVSATTVESVFWSDPRICTSQNPGKRILPESQRGSFANEIVTFHFSFDVTIIPSHQAIKGCIRRKRVLRFWRGIDLCGLRAPEEAEAKCGTGCKLKKLAARQI